MTRSIQCARATCVAVLVVASLSCASAARRTRSSPNPAPFGRLGPPAAAGEFEAACASGQVVCRKDVHIVLHRAKGRVYERSIPLAPPVLQADFMTIFPGETLHVEARAEGDRLVLEKVVERPVNPDRTLTFVFEQEEDGVGMQLDVRNPFPRAVKYDAAMMLLDDPQDGRLHPTSSCPVMPRIAALELWPDAIFQLVLKDFRFTTDGSCR